MYYLSRLVQTCLDSIFIRGGKKEKKKEKNTIAYRSAGFAADENKL